MAINEQTIIELEKRLMIEIDLLNEKNKELSVNLQTAETSLANTVAEVASLRQQIDQAHATISAVNEKAQGAQNMAAANGQALNEANNKISAVDHKVVKLHNHVTPFHHRVNNIYDKTDGTNAFNRLRDYLMSVNGNHLGFGD